MSRLSNWASKPRHRRRHRRLCGLRTRSCKGPCSIKWPVETSAGLAEYAALGTGNAVLIVHGAAGGFDQALPVTGSLAGHGFSLEFNIGDMLVLTLPERPFKLKLTAG